MTTSSITTASMSCSEENSSECLHDSVNSSQKKQTGNMQSTNLGSPSKTDDWSSILIKIAKDRDRVAFGKLFDHFAPKIKSYGMMLRSQHTSPQMAEELVQDVMLKVWLKAHCFDVNKASASTWIFTIARNYNL